MMLSLTTRRARTALTLAAATTGAAIALTSPAVAATHVGHTSPTISVVASGLGNPRSLAFGEGGVLYVALSGSGAADGSLIKIRHAASASPWAPVTVVSGLPSANDPHGAPPGVGTEGAVGVSVRDDAVYLQIGLFPLPVLPPTSAIAGPTFGDLLRVHGSTTTEIANVGAFDFAWANANKSLNPQFPDANPNAVLAVRGGEYVADAGANTLDWVDRKGHVSVLTYFNVPAESPTDAVPTCIAQGRDGALYIGELLGGQYAPGGARVWKVTRHGAKVHASVWATGLTAIQGCAIGRDGALYVTEFQSMGLNLSPTGSPVGDIVRVTHHSVTPLHIPGLFWPSGLAVGPDGSLFTSNCSIAPATGFGPCVKGGQVVRIKL